MVNIQEILTEVITTIESLKAIKAVEDYVEINSNITFKGNKTGKEFVISVKIDEQDNVIVDGDVSFINVIREAVKDYYGRKQR